MTTATSPILLKWDPKSLEIRTLTVERLLEPLVTQVSHELTAPSVTHWGKVVYWVEWGQGREILLWDEVGNF